MLTPLALAKFGVICCVLFTRFIIHTHSNTLSHVRFSYARLALNLQVIEQLPPMLGFVDKKPITATTTLLVVQWIVDSIGLAKNISWV